MPATVTEEIKQKLDIVQVLSEYLQVKKAGTRYVALCPFHQERSPSFSISPDNQFWYCFGCNEGGDVFGFVMRMEGLDFVEAKRMLAKKAGVVLREEDSHEHSERQRLKDINRWAAKFYHEVLLRSPQAAAARAYVEKRKLKPETIEDFLLGYSPDSWDATLNFLLKKGYKEEEIVKAGLAIKRDGRSGCFDRFRGRLMFPLCDNRGDIIGFTARIMPRPDGSEQKEAKYVNSPQTLIYDKGSTLYAFHLARRAIKEKGFAVIVEGNMDAIASHQAGVKNVVASSGTAFTSAQMHYKVLTSLANRLVLSFDGDRAGEKAARRSIDAVTAAGFQVSILRLPPGAGKDPDDCIRKDPALWTKAIDDAVPAMQWLIDLVRERTDLNDPFAIRTASEELIGEVAKLQNVAERSHWLRQLSELFHTPESVLFEKVQSLVKGAAKPQPMQTPSGAAPTPAPAFTKRPLSRDGVISQHILALIFRYPELTDAVVTSVSDEAVDDEFRQLYRDFVIHYNERRHDGDPATPFRLPDAQSFSREYADRIAFLDLLAEKEYGDLSGDARRDVAVRLIGELKQLHKSRRQRELIQAMKRAEQAADVAEIRRIEEQLNELIV